MARIRITTDALVNYAWLRHLAGEEVSIADKKALFGLHMDILRNGTIAYYNDETDELEVSNPETCWFMYMSKYAKPKKLNHGKEKSRRTETVDQKGS